MDIGAWCGLCGESFRLEEMVAAGYSGRCPRCGRDLSPGYAPVASAAVHEVVAAAASLEVAVGRLHDVAARLHIDGRKLCADLGDVLGEPVAEGRSG
jgi:hypothetical protein